MRHAHEAVARIAERRPALGGEVDVVGRQAERAVGLVERPRERVVRGDEHALLRHGDVEVHAERVESRSRNRSDFGDRSVGGDGADAVHRRVDIHAAEKMRPGAVNQHRVHADVCGNRLLDADHGLAQLRLVEDRCELDAPRRQHDRPAAGRGIGIAGLHDRFNLLMRAVELHGLFVRLRVQPVEEDPRPRAHRRLAAPERRPGDTAARPQLHPADVRLHFLPQARADRQLLPHTDVVLHIEPELGLRDRDARIANVARERRRLAERARVEAGEREGAGRVPQLARSIAAGLELQPRAYGVSAGRDVEVVVQLEEIEAAASRNLGAAAVERVQDEHGRRRAQRREREVVGAPLHAQIVEERLAHRAGERSAEHVLVARLAVGALGQIEIADAEIVRRGVAALEFGAEHLRVREHVLDAQRGVQRVVRLANRVGEEAGRQRGHDRLRIERVDALDRDRHRRVLFPERARQREAVALVPFVAFHGSEGVARVQRRVAKTDVGRSAPAVEARLGRDVDEHEAELVRVGGEHVSAEANLLDLVFLRQLAASESVDPHHGAGARHVAQHLLHLVGIVGQLVDLGLAEHRRKRVAARVAGARARVAADLHRLRKLRDRKLHLAAVVAAAHADVSDCGRLEPRRFDANCVAARIERSERRLAAAPGIARHVRDGHVRADDDRAARVEDRHAQRAERLTRCNC